MLPSRKEWEDALLFEGTTETVGIPNGDCTGTARGLRGDCTVSVQLPGYRHILAEQSTVKQRVEQRLGQWRASGAEQPWATCGQLQSTPMCWRTTEAC